MTVHPQASEYFAGQICSVSRTKLSNPETGNFSAMGRASKKEEDKLPMELREAIAENLQHYISHAKPPLNDERVVAARAGLHPKTIQRLRLPHSNPKAGTGLGTLARLAHVLDIDLSLLLRRRMMSGRETPQTESVINSASSAKQNIRKRRSE